jgi:hypothetical protein
MDRRRYAGLAACLALAGLALTGCSAAEAAPEAPVKPAQVVHIAGSDRSKVVLTADAAQRVGLTTEPITAAPKSAAATKTAAGAGPHLSVIPLAAVLYDKDGKTWAYTAPRPLTFVPVQLVIAHIDGDSATLTSGPAVGTRVVTVGGAELLGAEYGVPGEQ